ncbi:hypothetical protein [Bradyrhizobium sp. Tv2a-2]|uniref:hypothetical protein n=1 Tax=Bradyrhizobium sp. Tv2a-2 TaxID=113395 RepID=UPI0012EC0652|nr:hypothetical protein [Bradyrhizobium sp. Tv2a-2]
MGLLGRLGKYAGLEPSEHLGEATGHLGAAEDSLAQDFKSLADRLAHESAYYKNLLDGIPGAVGPRPTPEMLRVVNARTGNMDFPDPDEPPMPPEAVMAQYRDPNKLPGPTGYRTENGVRMVDFGRTTVPEQFAGLHQLVREHMAAGGPVAQKYLAHLEQADGPTVEMRPFDINDPNLPLRDFEDRTTGMMIRHVSIAHTDGKTYSVKRPVVAYAINAGIFTMEGRRVSAATSTAHELAHAARVRFHGSEIRDSWSSAIRLRTWRNAEEHYVITGVENEVAEKHGEGVRRSLTMVNFFETKSITSTEAADARAEEIMRNAKPGLEQFTTDMWLTRNQKDFDKADELRNAWALLVKDHLSPLIPKPLLEVPEE